MHVHAALQVLEIERLHVPVVVVSHLAAVQSLISYFTGRSGRPACTRILADACVCWCSDPNRIQRTVVPNHSVIKLVPSMYGWATTIIPEHEMPEDLLG